MYGSWDPTSSYDAGAFADYAGTHRLDLVNQLGMWVSPDRGILLWTPVLLLLPALWRSWPDQPDWAKAFLFAGVGYTLLQASLNRFSGGDQFYGYRLDPRVPGVCLPSAHRGEPLDGCAGPGGLAPPVIAAQFVAIMVGAVNDNAYVVSSDRCLDRQRFLLAFRAIPSSASGC